MLLARAVAGSCRFLRSATMTTHVERTQDSTRSKVTSEVVVAEVSQLTPSVKGFRLKASNRQLSFKPGQWVDLSIPGEEIVGGYSITSPPSLLAEKGELCLAILHSDHPPALWMHTKCRVGDTLSVQVGGDFYYAPATPTNLLLIAGGVGINPLFSMLQHHHTLVRSTKPKPAQPVSARLLYSAKNSHELLFKQEIDTLCGDSSEGSVISAKYFLTQESAPSSSNAAVPTTPCRRLMPADLAVALQGFKGPRPLCFVCGPPPMTEDVLTALRDMGVEHVHYEKWW